MRWSMSHHRRGVSIPYDLVSQRLEQQAHNTAPPDSSWLVLLQRNRSSTSWLRSIRSVARGQYRPHVELSNHDAIPPAKTPTADRNFLRQMQFRLVRISP